jgi:hypothetical protein
MDPSTYTTSSISELANLTQNQLPRELRDFIYSHLWTPEVVKALNYQDHLATTNVLYGILHNDPDRQICHCERPNSIPPFAQAKFVGHRFAREAVQWLFNNCPFTLTSSYQVPKFVLQDVFHVGLTPSVTSIRQLTLNFELHAYGSNRSASLLRKHLAALSEVKMHRSFRFNITFRTSVLKLADWKRYPVPVVYPLAAALKAIESVVTNIEGRSEASVKVVLEHHLLGLFNLKDMVGPIEKKRWFRFIDTRLMAAYDARMSPGIGRSRVAFEKLDFLLETGEMP